MGHQQWDAPRTRASYFDSWINRLSHIVGRLVPLDYIWYRGNTIVSFTFDDFPLSAATRALTSWSVITQSELSMPQTELLGAPHPCGRWRRSQIWNGWFPLATRLGLHTHETPAFMALHAAVFRRRTWRATPRPLSRAYATLFRVLCLPLWGLPFRNKKWLSNKLRGSRSVHPGVNAGLIDPHFLKSYELVDDHLSITDVYRLIDQAVEKRGWLIFTSQRRRRDP